MVKSIHVKYTYSDTCDGGIYLMNAEVENGYRGRGYFKKLIEKLLESYEYIECECFWTLLPMYIHLGFIDKGPCDEEGYHEIIKYRNDIRLHQ